MFLIVKKINNFRDAFRRQENQGHRNAGGLRVRPFVCHKNIKVRVHGKEETKARPQIVSGGVRERVNIGGGWRSLLTAFW